MLNNNGTETLESLRQGREDSSTAFMEFTEKKHLHKEYIFAFFEGEDGKYYNPRIDQIINQKFIHIKAGNKSKVLRTMHIIRSKKEYSDVKTMFFVDRDMDFSVEEYNCDDLYVTPCYSIENFYVNEESFGKILESEFGFNIDDNDYISQKNLFNKYYKEFCDMMTEFNALILLRKENGLNCDKVCIDNIKTKKIIKFDINNGLSLGGEYSKTINELKQKLNVTDQDIDGAKIRLSHYGDPCYVFRGKNQLDFLVEYIDQLCKLKDKIFEKKPTSVNINPNQNRLSTLSVYAKTPLDLIDFIKKYSLVENASNLQ